jgi:hypothetical protein
LEVGGEKAVRTIERKRDFYLDLRAAQSIISTRMRPSPNTTFDKISAASLGPDSLASEKGTRQIGVILYVSADPFWTPALADEISIEDILAAEHDVIPLDGADVFQ